jgi:hypothetical protein
LLEALPTSTLALFEALPATSAGFGRDALGLR